MRLASRKRVTLSARTSMAMPDRTIAMARTIKTSVMARAESTESNEKIKFIMTMSAITCAADFPDFASTSVSRCSIDSI